MMDAIEKATHEWAADKISTRIPAERITSVEFESEDLGTGCETCGHGGGAQLTLSIQYVDARRSRRIHDEDLGCHVNLAEVVREISALVKR